MWTVKEARQHRRVDTVLDLGGGPGTYAMALLANHPKLKATICDRPAAKEIAATHKARKRLTYLSVDFMEKDLALYRARQYLLVEGYRSVA